MFVVKAKTAEEMRAEVVKFFETQMDQIARETVRTKRDELLRHVRVAAARNNAAFFRELHIDGGEE